MVDTYRTLGNPVDERTPTLGLPLPHLLNDSRDDVDRLRQALDLIDAAQQLVELALADKAEGTELAALALSTTNALALKASSDSVQALADSTADALALKASADDVALLGQGAARASEAVLGYTAGRLTSITETLDGMPRVTNITYDGTGRLATVSYPVPGGKTRTEQMIYADGVLTGFTATEV